MKEHFARKLRGMHRGRAAVAAFAGLCLIVLICGPAAPDSLPAADPVPAAPSVTGGLQTGQVIGVDGGW